MAEETYFVAGGLDCVVASAGVTESTANVITGFSFVTLHAGSTATIGLGFSCPFIDQAAGTPSSLTNFWTHFIVKDDNGWAFPKVEWHDSTGTAWVRVYATASSTYQFQQNISGTWTAIGPVFDTTNNTTIDVYIDIAAAGQIGCFVNGVPQGTFIGDTSAIGSLSSLACCYAIVSAYFQQIVVANYNTIGCTVRARKVTAAGDTQQWTGPYTSVSTYPMSTTTAITTATDNEINTYAGTTLSATPTGQVIHAVALSSYSRIDTTGPQNVVGLLEISSTNYNAPYNMGNMGYGYNGGIAIWAKNPATSAAWASITEANCNFGIESQA